MEKFNELSKKVGFGLAVVVMADSLPESFYQSLSSSQWMKIYRYCLDDSLGHRVMQALITLKRFSKLGDDLLDLYDSVPKEGKMEELLIAHILELANGVKEQKQVIETIEVGNDSKLRKLVFSKIFAEAVTLKEKNELLNEACHSWIRNNGEIEMLCDSIVTDSTGFEEYCDLFSRTKNEKMLSGMLMTADSFERRFDVYKRADESDNQEIKTKALEAMKAAAKTHSDNLIVRGCLSKNDSEDAFKEAKKITKEEVAKVKEVESKETCQSFYALVDLYGEEHGSNLGKWAKAKIFSEPRSYDELMSLCSQLNYFPEEISLLHESMKMMFGRKLSLSQLKGIVESNWVTDEYAKRAITEMKKLVKT